MLQQTTVNTVIPRKAAALRSLPGFGPYTTHAVLSIAFGQRLSILDANVKRIVMRLLALKAKPSVRVGTRILNFLEKVLPQREISDFNQALMELGALVCRPQEPLCLSCPVKDWCRAFKNGWQDVIPVPKQKLIKHVEAVCGVIENKGRFFLQKRLAKELLADLWEFPGGKIEPGESVGHAVLREIKEEVGVDAISAKPWLIIRHAYTRFKVTLHAWRCQVRFLPTQDAAHRWLRPCDFKKYPMPSATARIAGHLTH